MWNVTPKVSCCSCVQTCICCHHLLQWNCLYAVARANRLARLCTFTYLLTSKRPAGTLQDWQPSMLLDNSVIVNGMIYLGLTALHSSCRHLIVHGQNRHLPLAMSWNHGMVWSWYSSQEIETAFEPVMLLCMSRYPLLVIAVFFEYFNHSSSLCISL